MKNLTITLSLENKKVVWKKSSILPTKKCMNPVINNDKSEVTTCNSKYKDEEINPTFMKI